jgi:hypothetical protein
MKTDTSRPNDPDARCNRIGDTGRVEYADTRHMNELRGIEDEHSTEEYHG